MKVLFVCLGNICRSPGAEQILRDKLNRRGITGWTVDSAGTGDYHIGELPDRRMRSAAAARGYSLTHHCRQVRRSDFSDFDLIIGMDANNVRNLLAIAPPEARQKVQPIGQWLDPSIGYNFVPDPYYDGPEGFQLALDLMEQACDNLIEEHANS